ncbi:MAG TPA: 50S ribosomal protein L30 [Bacteroidales bacterium]|nr:50S ribosomal protein L30 [Bacteroidales bacterium]HOK73743.1 50S ribosomal protein L30 [Bacteroidales bacterium]HPP91523.1 50S ribosomal protein L30 [Bacteroidales bacterium]
MAKIKITQIRSKNRKPERHKRILAALGIHRLHQSVVHEATPQILGMVEKIKHLVKTEEVE